MFGQNFYLLDIEKSDGRLLHAMKEDSGSQNFKFRLLLCSTPHSSSFPACFRQG